MFSGNTKATFQAVMADAPNITRGSAWFTVPYKLEFWKKIVLEIMFSSAKDHYIIDL